MPLKNWARVKYFNRISVPGITDVIPAVVVSTTKGNCTTTVYINALPEILAPSHRCHRASCAHVVQFVIIAPVVNVKVCDSVATRLRKILAPVRFIGRPFVVVQLLPDHSDPDFGIVTTRVPHRDEAVRIL